MQFKIFCINTALLTKISGGIGKNPIMFKDIRNGYNFSK